MNPLEILSEFKGWPTGWAIPDRRKIYEWAAQYLTLPSSYAVQGRFDVSLTRPLMEIFDDIQNPLVTHIRFRKPPRFGGSMIADIAIPWICCNDPGPIAWNWQTDADAKAHMKEKVWALWRSCKPFKAILPRERRDRTTSEIYFGPFFMVCQGANLSNLQSKGIRWEFNDEIWLPVWQELYQHAVARTGDYERAGSFKIVDVSQAGNANDVEDRNWRQGHQAVWGYRCPVDGKHYPLVFDGAHEDGKRFGLVWNEDARRPDGSWNKARAVETVRYRCPVTGHEWPDTVETREAWNREGRYLVTNPDVPPSLRSYAVNGLLNYSMAKLAGLKIDALEQASRGDLSAMKIFNQQYACKPWEETLLTVTVNTLAAGYTYSNFANGERWEGETKRSMAVDRQMGAGSDLPHRWIEVRAWRSNGDSRQLFYGRVETKEATRDLQKRYLVPDRCVFMDIAWERHEALAECSAFGWLGMRGSDEGSWSHFMRNPQDARNPLKIHLPYSPVQQTTVGGPRDRAMYIIMAESYFSDILAHLLAGRGAKFELPDDCSPEYLEQIKGEHKIEKRPGVYKWEKLHAHSPNHGWDCSKMGVAFAVIMHLLSEAKELQVPQPAGTTG